MEEKRPKKKGKGEELSRVTVPSEDPVSLSPEGVPGELNQQDPETEPGGAPSLR